MKRNISWAAAVGFVLLVVPVAVAGTFSHETWEGSTVGSDYCTVNPGTPWVCVGSIIGTLEFREAFTPCSGPNHGGIGGEVNCFKLAAQRDDPLGNSAPNMYRDDFAIPTSNYQVTAEYKAQTGNGGANGDFVIFRLSDVNGTNFLQLGFRDADGLLDITNDTGFDETSYDAPNAWRNYTVEVNVTAKTYNVRVFDYATPPNEVFTRLNQQFRQVSDGKVEKVTVGSLSIDDGVVGVWDHLKIWN